MGAFTASVRDRALHTPAGRERAADLLRAAAICVVVGGHWLAVAVSYEDGELSGRNALDVVSWSHPLTWLFQVMPIFFLVGGYANAASFTSHRRRGGDAMAWVLWRTDRLLRPTTALLLVVPVTAAGAVLLGASEALVGMATWLASIPLWFLLAYLGMIVLTPWMLAVHRRAGIAVPIALVAAVAAADALRMGLGVPYVSEISYLTAWLAVHQAGLCWRDGLLPTGRLPAAAWTALAIGALLCLTLAGPYEIRMVGVNTAPPTLALMALAAAQTGLVLLLRPPLNRWLQRTGPWTVVVALNAVVLTIFVWHMAAAVVAAIVVYPGGLMAQPPVGSVAWFVWRIPWVAACALVLLPLVALFGRIELRRSPLRSRAVSGRRSAAAVAGLAAVLSGLLGVALADRAYHGLGGLPPAAVLSYLAGAAILRAARSGRLGRLGRWVD